MLVTNSQLHTCFLPPHQVPSLAGLCPSPSRPCLLSWVKCTTLAPALGSRHWLWIWRDLERSGSLSPDLERSGSLSLTSWAWGMPISVVQASLSTSLAPLGHPVKWFSAHLLRHALPTPKNVRGPGMDNPRISAATFILYKSGEIFAQMT